GVGNAAAAKPEARTAVSSSSAVKRGNERRPPRPGQGRARVSSSVGKKFGAGAALTAGVPPVTGRTTNRATGRQCRPTGLLSPRRNRWRPGGRHSPTAFGRMLLFGPLCGGPQPALAGTLGKPLGERRSHRHGGRCRAGFPEG